jgi:hypothetical protein
MKTFIAILALLGTLEAEDCNIELRGSSTEYRYADAACTLKNGFILDGYYIGVPKNNEISLGFGYQWKPIPALSLTPLLYGVVGKEKNQRGVKFGLMGSFTKSQYTVAGYLAKYQILKGTTTNYLVLDTLDVTRTVSKHWEIGTSTGLFLQDNKWNPQYGGVTKLNDKAGYTAISYRFGVREFRISRSFVIKR